MIWLAWTFVLAGLTAPDAPSEASSTCHIEHTDAVALELVLETPWDDWQKTCEVLDTYLALPKPPLATQHLTTSVQALHALGYFSTVLCDVRDDGKTLFCTLKPALLVRSFDIGGDVPFALLRADLRRRIATRPGTLITNPNETMTRQSQRLRSFLEGEGYFNSRIDVELVPQTGAEPNAGVHVQITVHPGITAQVRHVTVNGDHKIPDDTLGNIFRHWWFLWSPMRFRPTQFNDDVRAATEMLQNKGWPAAHVSGKYTHDADAGAIDIELEVRAGPRVDLKFVNNTALSDGDLKDLAGFREAGAVDTVATDELRTRIIEQYQREGHYDVDVSTDIRKDDEATWTVTYTLTPGPEARLEHVMVVGNLSVSRRDIDHGVDFLTQPSGFFSRRWVNTWVAHDIAALEAFYRAKGFTQVHVSAAPTLRGVNALDAVFTIEEGPRRAAVSMRVEGEPDDLDIDPLWPQLTIHAGAPLIESNIDHDVQELQTELAAKGYTQAVVTPQIETSAVTYHVTPGEQMRSGGLLLRGNFKTSERFLRNEIPVKVGDVLDLPALGAARRNLRALNIFNSVDLKPLVVYPDNGITWLLLGLEERDVRTLDAVLSFSSDNFFSVGADYADRNLFGRAISFDVQLRLANASEWIWPRLRIGNEDRLEAKLRAPRPLGLPFDAEASALYDYQDVELYKQRRIGGTAAVSKMLLSSGRCSACPNVVGKLGYELISAYLAYKDLVNDDPAAEAAAEADLTRINIPSQAIARIVPSVSIDKRDSVVDPQSGYRFDVRLEVAHPVLAGPFYRDASAFWRTITGAQGFLNLGAPLTRRIDDRRRVGGPVVAALSLQYSAAGPWTADGRVPLSETFAYGGDFSVRGLALEASRVAIPDAHYMVTGTFELRWYALPELGFGTVQVAGFTDFGSVSRSLDGLLQTNTVSVGPILRYVTPVGPLSLAYGWPVVRPLDIAGPRPDVIPTTGRFHFTFGYSF